MGAPWGIIIYLMILDKVSERCGYYDHEHDYDTDRYLNAFWGREKTLASKVTKCY
jgi:hypothetical protein